VIVPYCIDYIHQVGQSVSHHTNLPSLTVPLPFLPAPLSTTIRDDYNHDQLTPNSSKVSLCKNSQHHRLLSLQPKPAFPPYHILSTSPAKSDSRVPKRVSKQRHFTKRIKSSLLLVFSILSTCTLYFQFHNIQAQDDTKTVMIIYGIEATC